jgi:hypothetical protein
MTTPKPAQNISENTPRITMGDTTITLQPDGTIVTTTVKPEKTEIGKAAAEETPQ